MRRLPAIGTVEIAPSILSADFSCLAEEIRRVEPYVNILHLDIMDGHFVPNITIGPAIVEKIRPHSELFFDVHLMITDPEKYAPEFVKAGADGITFHWEATKNPRDMIKQLRDLGVAVGVSYKLMTDAHELEPIIEEVDMVLLMTIEPGFGGQAYIPDSTQRCVELKGMLREDQRLEVDGGINPTTTPIITGAGADTLVAGSAIFCNDDPAGVIQSILAAAKKSPKL